MGAALLGSGVGLALGAGYMTAGLAQAVSDHHRAVRIAEAVGGGLSDAMLQREIGRMDPATVRIARTHDAHVADPTIADPAQAWPGGVASRLPAGRHGEGLQGARDLDCLTEAVYFEARGETPRGQAAVAQVVMNRVANPSFPKTVCGVVFQGAATHGCQFSFACDGSMAHALQAEAWDRARRVAERALSGVVLADLHGATHFHTLDVEPGWGPQMLRVTQVGLHVFYRFNPHAPAVRAEPPAVFAGLPMTPVANLRLASAVLEKASEVSVQGATLAAQSTTTEAKTTAVAPAAPAADKAGEPANARAPADS